MQTVESVLDTLRSRVLANEHVSKTVKVQLFNNTALDQVGLGLGNIAIINLTLLHRCSKSESAWQHTCNSIHAPFAR